MIGVTTLHGLLMQASSEPISLSYGYLYNWYTASDTNFAPNYWRIPTQSESSSLITYAGGIGVAGGKLKITGYDQWNSPNTGATNEYDFSFVGCGRRTSGFEYINRYGWYWASTTSTTFLYQMSYNNDNVSSSSANSLKYYGASVRLIYTGTGTPTSITDIDGNIYDVVQIGTQYWTVQNWKCTKLNNGTAIPNVTDNTTWAGLTTGARCAYDNNQDFV